MTQEYARPQPNGQSPMRARHGGWKPIPYAVQLERGFAATAGERTPLDLFLVATELFTDWLPHGDGLVAHGYVRALAQAGHRLVVVAPIVDVRAPLPSNVELVELSAPGGVAATRRLVFSTRARRLFDTLARGRRFDLIHQMNPGSTGISLAFAGVRVPVVVGTYSFPWWPERPAALLGRLRLRVGDAVKKSLRLAQERLAAALLVTTPSARYGLVFPSAFEAKIYELRHGVDASAIVPAAQPVREPVVLFLANVQERKGILTLIEAFARVREAVADARLVVAGDGEALAAAQDRVDRLGLRSAVTFAGRIERRRIASVLQTAAVYCLPSFGEPYGVSAIEAMAAGLPIVSTDRGGPGDYVPREGGFTVAPRDPSALAEALIELLRSPDLRARMGAFNRRAVETMYTNEIAAARLESLYRLIIASWKAERTKQA